MRSFLFVAAGAVALAACGNETPNMVNGVAPTTLGSDGGLPKTDDALVATAPAQNARATLRDASGAERGTATVAEGPGGLTLTVEATGLPAGERGFHIHTTGRCDAPSFETAGAHWNPTDRQHGRDNPQGQHLGDLPNITIAADGTGRATGTVANATVQGATNPLLDADGAAIIIHERADDYESDPTGDAGGRIACGVFEPAL